MAVTAPVPPDYQPITEPPGGLLASAVGTVQQPQPPIDPNTYENDDVVAEVNRITSQDSDYMKLATNSGMQTANRRGLLNTSIAAGAAEASRIAAAAPLATTNAQLRGQRNQERLASYFAGQRQEAQFGHEEGMQQRQFTQQDAVQLRDIAARQELQAADIEAQYGLQGLQNAQDILLQKNSLTAQEEAQLRDISARISMQETDIAAQYGLQSNDLASREQLAQMQIDAAAEQLGRQLTAQEEAQIRDIASREGMLATELASREALTREGYQNEIERLLIAESGATDRANLDAATRVQITELNNMSNEQIAQLNYYLQSNQIYAQSLDRLYANNDMPAPARDEAMQNFLALRNSTANLPATLFGTQTSWSGGTAPETTGDQTAGGTGSVTNSDSGTAYIPEAGMDGYQVPVPTTGIPEALLAGEVGLPPDWKIAPNGDLLDPNQQRALDGMGLLPLGSY